MTSIEPFVMYETKIKDFTLNLEDGRSFWFPETLSNGRASYIVFEWLVRELAELYKAKKSDHTDGELLYEQKSYIDPLLDPKNKADLFPCAPSSVQGPNNYGPTIKSLLADGDYHMAYEICAEKGYGLNDFYVFTNTGQFDVSVPFRFFIIPTATLLEHLDDKDPRLVSRKTLLSLIVDTQSI
jgi:hypothetical protein